MFFSYKNMLIRYTLKGKPSGQTILLVHGFTENIKMWKPLVKALKKDYYLIAVDLIGHGKSGINAEVISMEEQAEMLKALLDFQGIGQVTLIGHSMGGYISLAFAELFPQYVKGLVLLNSHPFADSAEKIRARRIGIEAVKKNKFKFLAETIPGFFAAYNRDKLKSAIEKLVAEANKMPVKGISASLSGMIARKDRSELFFNETAFPKAWITSQDDPLIDSEAFKLQAEKAKSLYFRIIRGGHMSYLENPEEMIESILIFLNQKNNIS